MEKRFQVVIVGGGPVGVALAVDLGQRGVSCALVERNLAPQRIPKGQNLSNRTLEHFYFWGCLPELRAARVMPGGYPIGGVTAYGDLKSDYWYASIGAGGRGEGVAQYYYQANERLPQYLTEEVLRNRLRDVPNVTTYFGWNVETIETDANGARIAIAPLSADAKVLFSWSAEAEQKQTADAADRDVLVADYVVGCDGGRSLVRETIGIERSGKNFEQRMLLSVFRSKELHEALERFPPRTTYRVLKPELEGVWQFFGRIDVGEGFFFHAPVPADATLDDFDFHAVLHEAAGFEFAADFEYIGFWDLRIMTADQYSKGRAFIAGDAAHQHPPYGGFGLNTGLEDARNLAWKLAAVVQGWGGPTLLESYTQERRPIFQETGELVIAGGINRDRVFLETFSPEKDLAAFEEAWGEMSTGNSERSDSYDPHYEGSSVVMSPPDAAPGIFGTQTLAALAGHHLAPQLLSNGHNVYEALGQDFCLLAFDADEAAVKAIEDAAKALAVPMKTVRDSFADGRVIYDARLVLVRPDEYVAWAGYAAPSDAEAMLRKVTGR